MKSPPSVPRRTLLHRFVIIFTVFSITSCTGLMSDEIRMKQRQFQKSIDTMPSLKIPNTEGLSKFHQSILSRTVERQRFLTGRDPLLISFTENPTRKWLRLDGATTEILVNGTTPQKSIASLDRFAWLDHQERRELVEAHNMLTMELIAEIKTERPGYLNLLPSSTAGRSAAASRKQNQRRKPSILDYIEDRDLIDQDRLWVTGFSLAGRRGILKSVDGDSGDIVSVRDVTSSAILWPNEVQKVPKHIIGDRVEGFQDALLVADGFLVPGKDRGGIYLVRNPGNPETEIVARLTDSTRHRWFYHRAIWIDLTNDGRKSILTARCRISTIANSNEYVTSGVSQQGELVWLECPKPYAFDSSGDPIEVDGGPFDPFAEHHLPWKEHKLADGPDVMFSVADMNINDDSIEIISSEFFNKKVMLRSIRLGPEPEVIFERTIDKDCGPTFGSLLAELSYETDTHHKVVDSGSTVETLKPGDSFSHLLVTSHEGRYESKEAEPGDIESNIRTGSEKTDGGSLFAYRAPRGKNAWKTKEWKRTVVATGFKVNGRLSNIINPGAPGFVYSFHESLENTGQRRPMIAVAGDCSESAYIFRPDYCESADPDTCYKLMAEIKCGSTVGSIGIGYSEFTNTPQESGYAKVYIPCFEKDKVLVFALGSGKDAIEDDDGW